MAHVAQQICLAFVAGYLLQVALAGAGARDFLDKRPGLNQDVKLWNEFLKSENQPGDQGSADDVPLESDVFEPGEADVAFIDATLQGRGQHEVALRSCLRKYGGPSAAMPKPVPHGNLAAVAAAAVASLMPATKGAEKLLRVQLEACLESTERENLAEKTSNDFTEMQRASDNATALAAKTGPPQKMPKVKAAFVTTSFVETNFTGPLTPCAKSLKRCKKDTRNCKHVLDIMQFLRLKHMDVEKAMQREAQAKHGGSRDSWKLLQEGSLLQNVLEKNGLSVPKAEDWDWAGANKLLLQNALEQHVLALMEQDSKEPDYLVHLIPDIKDTKQPPLNHPIPEVIPSHYHQKLPVQATMKISMAKPVGLRVHEEVHHSRCSPHVQKKLDDCSSSLESCKVDVDNHNTLLNSIADRAAQEPPQDRKVKLNKFS